jgi:hypothetical protein
VAIGRNAREPLPGACYAKVVSVDIDACLFTVRFTAQSDALVALRRAAAAR